MVQSLADEIVLRKNELTETVQTIYFGGGTPSLLTDNELQFLLNTIEKHYKVSKNPEITLEANPDDLSDKKILELADTRINRLSVGIQSFFDDDLKMMNRAHTSEESISCLSAAIGSFENITVDLIYGIPKMSVAKWKENLKRVFDFDIPHISSYALTVEPKTALDSFIKSGKYPPLDEALAAEHFNILVEETNKKEFVQYEVSNFGKPNFFSKHNTSYWKGTPYLGIGPSAHSFMGIQRSWNVSNNAQYIKSIQQNILPHEIEILSKKDQFNEYVMTGLRTIWGISLDHIERKFGIKAKHELLGGAQKHMDNKKLEIKMNCLVTTPKGKFLADGIASDLFTL